MIATTSFLTVLSLFTLALDHGAGVNAQGLHKHGFVRVKHAAKLQRRQELLTPTNAAAVAAAPDAGAVLLTGTTQPVANAAVQTDSSSSIDTFTIAQSDFTSSTTTDAAQAAVATDPAQVANIYGGVVSSDDNSSAITDAAVAATATTDSESSTETTTTRRNRKNGGKGRKNTNQRIVAESAVTGSDGTVTLIRSVEAETARPKKTITQTVTVQPDENAPAVAGLATTTATTDSTTSAATETTQAVANAAQVAAPNAGDAGAVLLPSSAPTKRALRSKFVRRQLHFVD